jgi:hypothetical protein
MMPCSRAGCSIEAQHKQALLLWKQPLWKRCQNLQLVSSTCHCFCHMLCCCMLNRVPCIVMRLYPKSAQLLEDCAGQPDSSLALCLGLCAWVHNRCQCICLFTLAYQNTMLHISLHSDYIPVLYRCQIPYILAQTGPVPSPSPSFSA